MAPAAIEIRFAEIERRFDEQRKYFEDHEEESSTERREGFASVRSDLSDLRKEVHTLVAWKNKYAGAMALALLMLGFIIPYFKWTAETAINQAVEKAVRDVRQELGAERAPLRSSGHE